jgi:hypothetical protein
MLRRCIPVEEDYPIANSSNNFTNANRNFNDSSLASLRRRIYSSSSPSLPTPSLSPSLSVSSDSSQESLDVDSFNHRVTPHWPAYRDVLRSRGFDLDTYRTVNAFFAKRTPDSEDKTFISSGYHKGREDDALCQDPGLPDNLFRGLRIYDSTPVVVKAVHLHSREFTIMRLVSSPELRQDPMNHCIREFGPFRFPPRYRTRYLRGCRSVYLF